MRVANSPLDQELLLRSGCPSILGCYPDCELRLLGVIGFQFQYTPVQSYIARHTGEM